MSTFNARIEKVTRLPYRFGFKVRFDNGLEFVTAKEGQINYFIENSDMYKVPVNVELDLSGRVSRVELVSK